MKGKLEDRLNELNSLYPLWEKETIWQKFKKTVNRFPKNDFIVQDGRKGYTYEDGYKEIQLLAKGFLEIGIKPGDHVAIQLRNSLELVLASFALLLIGAVKVNVNLSLVSKELEYILTQSDSNFFISEYPERLINGEMLNNLKEIILLKESSSICIDDTKITLWSDLRHKGAKADEKLLNSILLRQVDADEVSDIIYTSGSTGNPKGVILSHDMLLRSAFASCLNRGFEIGRRIYVPLPLCHSYGYVEGLLAAILVGGTVLINDGKFNVEESLKFMFCHNANDILSVPSQMIGIIEFLRKTPMQFPELHSVYCSATTCPIWVWSDIKKYLDVDDLITGYGMTEVCGASMQTQPFDSLEILSTRVGKILPGGYSGFPEFDGCQIQYKVVDLVTGNTCSLGENGELWCRGAVVTKGYYKKPIINKASFLDDGWFKTGDIGKFDKDGYLKFDGRIDDVYKINGENVSPKLIEDIVGNCETVNIIEVVGIANDKLGAVGVAFIQLHEDTVENRLITEQYCSEHLAYFQVPKHIFYFSSKDWPRTSSGKIQKFKLRKIAQNQLCKL